MDVKRYNNLSSIVLDNAVPSAHVPTPSETDYTNGYIIRTFIQQRATPGTVIIEIGPNQNNSSGNPYYQTVSLRWKISGPLEDKWVGKIYHPSVQTTNRLAVNNAALIMPDIKLYLVNLKQFWRASW